MENFFDNLDDNNQNSTDQMKAETNENDANENVEQMKKDDDNSKQKKTYIYNLAKDRQNGDEIEKLYEKNISFINTFYDFKEEQLTNDEEKWKKITIAYFTGKEYDRYVKEVEFLENINKNKTSFMFKFNLNNLHMINEIIEMELICGASNETKMIMTQLMMQNYENLYKNKPFVQYVPIDNKGRVIYSSNTKLKKDKYYLNIPDVNVRINRVKGIYVAILNSDDLNKSQKLYGKNYFKNSNVKFLATNNLREKEYMKLNNYLYNHYKDKIAKKKFIIEESLLTGKVPNFKADFKTLYEKIEKKTNAPIMDASEPTPQTPTPPQTPQTPQTPTNPLNPFGPINVSNTSSPIKTPRETNPPSPQYEPDSTS